MYSITKGELIFILDLAEEIQSAGGSCESFLDEVTEVVTIVNGILDNGEEEKV